MRALWVVLLVCGCKKEEPAGPPPPPPPPKAKPAVVVDAGAAPDATRAALIDLGKSVPLEITVSSQVDNPAILPAHLVDRDLNTAWNSRTNELEGAWIEVAAPPGATIAELRFTVGHTGHGKKGEDYFTMNPRIEKVNAVDVQLGKEIGRYKLDIANRGLQTVHFAPTRVVRLEIVDVTLGSKRLWRETCVSELEVWGTPAPGFAAPAKALTPTVTVAPPPPAPTGPCADIEELKAERQKRRDETNKACHELDANAEGAAFCGIDEAGDPECTSGTMPIDKVGKHPDELVVTCETSDNIYGDGTCTITDPSGGRLAQLVGNKNLSVEKITATDADGRLALRIATSGDQTTEYLVICGSDKCSAPIALAGEDWRVKARVQGVMYSTSVVKGQPPTDTIVENKPLF